MLNSAAGVRQLPRALYYVGFYIGAVALVALGVGFATAGRFNEVGQKELLWSSLIAFFTYLGGRFIRPIAPKMKMEVTTCSVFAAVLLLPVPLAMAAVAVGQMAAAAQLKRHWYNTFFNGAEAALRAAVGGLVFGAIVGAPLLVSQG